MSRTATGGDGPIGFTGDAMRRLIPSLNFTSTSRR